MKNVINEKIELNLYSAIKKYPFNGRSKYLIDKFYLIGYDYETAHKLLFDTKIEDLINEKEESKSELDLNELTGAKNENTNISEYKPIFPSSNSPILLNEITSDFKKQLPDFDLIRKMLFPNGSQFFYLVEDYTEENCDITKENILRKSVSSSIFGNDDNKKNKKRKLPESYRVVFSNNPQEGVNSKKSINGFAYVFYKKHSEARLVDNKKYTFYIPYTFCIISEYPFFNSFFLLCKQLYNLIKNKIDIPLEIIIYNIVNYTPSPINSDVFIDLNLFNSSSNNEDLGIIKEIEIEDEEEDNIKNREKNNKRNIIKKYSQLDEKSERNIENVLRQKGIKTLALNRTKSENIFSSSSTINKTKDSIKFELLSGYPLIQYNLVKVLLNGMIPEHIITIFFYTFLEKSVVFFSKNIELLSLTINSYLNLNFPLNDEKYYCYNTAISYDNYMEGNSIFVGTTFTCVIGINSKYQKYYKYNKHVRLSEHLTVDLDNGKINHVKDEKPYNDDDEEEEKKDTNIFDFINKIIKDKDLSAKQMNTILYKEVKNIFQKLSSYKELFKKNNTIKKGKDSYKKVINGSYIDYNEQDIKKANRDIQESFYALVNKLCIYFYQNLMLQNNNEEILNVVFDEESIGKGKNNIPEEMAFLNELRETMKYQSFVCGFIQSNNPIDLYKIPLTFTEEFLSMLARNSSIYNNKEGITFLSLIDNIYNRTKYKEINIELNDFYSQYTKKLKNIIDREIYDNKNEDKIKIFLKENNKDQDDIIIEGMQYLSYEFNNDIIFKYKYIMDNLNEKQLNFLLKNQNIIKENQINEILLNDIESSIENHFMELGLIKKDDICCTNILILFVISMRFIVKKEKDFTFFPSLFNHYNLFRKYYTMIFEVLYFLMKERSEKDIQTQNCLMIYFLLFNVLRSLGLIPNESLNNIINKIKQLNINFIQNTEQNNERKSEGNEKDNMDENINEYIYFCYNFDKYRFFKEKEILNAVNNIERNEDSKLDSEDNKRIEQSKIRFNNRKEKYEFEILSQMEIFELLNNKYMTYIRNLDDSTLVHKEMFKICLNIIVYFRNMDDFDGKDEIDLALIHVMQYYLNKFSKK